MDCYTILSSKNEQHTELRSHHLFCLAGAHVGWQGGCLFCSPHHMLVRPDSGGKEEEEVIYGLTHVCTSQQRLHWPLLNCFRPSKLDKKSEGSREGRKGEKWRTQQR